MVSVRRCLRAVRSTVHLQVSLDVHNNLRECVEFTSFVSGQLSVVSCRLADTSRGILAAASQASGMCTNVPKGPMLHLEAEFRLCSTTSIGASI